MPIFEYQCRDCGKKFEKIIASSAATKVACKQCGSPRVTTLLSTFAVAGASAKSALSEPGLCACGAPRRGMCQE